VAFKRSSIQMKHTLRSVLFAGTALVCLSGTAHANLFDITETLGDPGYYTVTDNSPDLYIYGFSITHAPGAFGPGTTQQNWVAGFYGCGSCSGNEPFYYHNTDPISVLTNDIQINGGSSNQFSFYSPFLASDYTIFLTDGTNTSSVSGSTNATPLPAALPLMGTVLGAGYLVFRRRSRSRKSVALSPA
jgi:hypothetical protein